MFVQPILPASGAERMGKANLNRGANSLIHAITQRRVTKTSAPAKCVWPDGTTSSAHQAGFWFYVQSMKGHDAACQRHTKEGQGQEFLHCVSPFKINPCHWRQRTDFGLDDFNSEPN